jgi:hypothetical protein
MHLSVKQSFATVLLEIENHDELVPHERSSITRERQLKLMATLFTAKTCLSAVDYKVSDGENGGRER